MRRSLVIVVTLLASCVGSRAEAQTREISVAQEHFATAATQVIIAQLAHGIFGRPKAGHTLVAAGVVGDLHELGLRMLCDLFELGVARRTANGWLAAGGATYTLGVVFFLLDERWPLMHGVWHLFVLGGSASHFVTVLFFVV